LGEEREIVRSQAVIDVQIGLQPPHSAITSHRPPRQIG
jgi:hypothetical protein